LGHARESISEALVDTSQKNMFYGWRLLAPHLTPKLEGHPVGSPQLLIQYVRSYPPYLEGISSICNLRTHHALVTRNPLNMAADHTASPNSLNIFHQNIRGLRNKSDELTHSFEIDGIHPHVLCLSKHHMVKQDLLHLTLAGYLLGSSFCRLNLHRGGASFC
jgi:hypothetical protein